MNITNADIKNLKDKKFKKDNKLFIVEGNKFCHDLLNSDIEIILTLTTEKELKDFPNIEIVSEKMLSNLATTKTNQSIICVCKIKEFKIDSVGNSLILDNLQDPGNVGTLIRSALAFGFKDIYLVGGADAFSEKVIRSSAGTILKSRLHIVDFETIKNEANKIADYFAVAHMFGDSINEIHLPNKRIAVIIGNEGQGVSEDFMKLANIKLAIPMCEGVESLNAGVAGSIIMQKLGEI